MIWKLNKRSDTDLMSNNLKPWIDIFGVSWAYWWLVTSRTPVWMAYSNNDDDIYDEATSWRSNNIAFYDDWTKVICMWVVSASQTGWLTWKSYYYLEINKSTLLITRAPLVQYWWSSYSSPWDYLSIQNIWWTNRYCFGWHYYNWTNLVTWAAAWTNVWVGSFDFLNGFFINQLVWNSVFNGIYLWGSFWQTFNSWAWWNIAAIRLFLRGNFFPWNRTWSVFVEIYSWVFSTLLWTSTPIELSNISTWDTPCKFTFSWINLSPSTQYSFRLYFTSPFGDVVIRPRVNADWNDYYNWGVAYINWSVFWSTVDMVFQIMIWSLLWTATGGVEAAFFDWAYNDIGWATWFLNFS